MNNIEQRACRYITTTNADHTNSNRIEISNESIGGINVNRTGELVGESVASGKLTVLNLAPEAWHQTMDPKLGKKKWEEKNWIET